jgi:hypothetical protein
MPRLTRLYDVAKRSIEYLLATYPIPDQNIRYEVVLPTTTVSCADDANAQCGYAAVWEEGVERKTFFTDLLTHDFTKGYDFVVAVTCGGGGASTLGFDQAVAIGDEAGDQILAHEFNHAIVGVYDVYSADCLVGWAEAYCEHSDGQREYCCIDGLDPDHFQDYACGPDANGAIQCDYSHLVSKSCEYSCSDACASICADGTVFSGPDGRVRHPASKGFWVNKWIEIDDRFNYFMDARIETGTSYPWMWTVLGNTTYHCYWGFGPVDNQDGFLNDLNHPRFKAP